MAATGRPPYEPTEKDRRIVEMLSGLGVPNERIAQVIGIDPKTLRKHHRESLDVGYAKLEAQLVANLLRIAQGSDRQALTATTFALKARFGWVEAAAPPREAPLGKKEQRQANAKRLAADHRGSVFSPPPPPRALRELQ